MVVFYLSLFESQLTIKLFFFSLLCEILKSLTRVSFICVIRFMQRHVYIGTKSLLFENLTNKRPLHLDMNLSSQSDQSVVCFDARNSAGKVIATKQLIDSNKSD